MGVTTGTWSTTLEKSENHQRLVRYNKDGLKTFLLSFLFSVSYYLVHQLFTFHSWDFMPLINPLITHFLHVNYGNNVNKSDFFAN